MEEVGKRIKFLREKQGLSGEEFAKDINQRYGAKFSRSVISRWENGKMSLNRKNLNYYANYFNVTMDWIINGDVPTKRNNNFINEIPSENYHIINLNCKKIKFEITLTEEEINSDINKITENEIKLLEELLKEIYFKKLIDKK